MELGVRERAFYNDRLQRHRDAGHDLVFDKRHGYATAAIERCPVTQVLTETLDFFAALGVSRADD